MQFEDHHRDESQHIHTVIKCTATKDTLRIYFDEGEVLSVLLPDGFAMDKNLPTRHLRLSILSELHQRLVNAETRHLDP